MVQFGEAYSEDEVLLGPSSNSQVLLDSKVIIDISLINDQLPVDEQSEEDDDRVPLWVEVVWLVALIGTMVTLLLNLFLHRPWLYGPPCVVHHFILAVHHFILAVGYVKLPPHRSLYAYTSGSRTTSRRFLILC